MAWQRKSATMNKIILSDAFDGISGLDDKSIDLCILDPNYQDWSVFIKRGLIELVMSKMKDEGNVLAFTRQPFDYDLRVKINPLLRRTFIWSFTNGGAWVSKTLPLVSFQSIFWFSKSKKPYVNVRTGVSYSSNTKSFKRSNKVFGDWNEEGRDFAPSNEGTWIRDHYHFNKPHTGKIPSKPAELARIFVNCFCPAEGILLDPFAGSGTFCKAASSAERNYIAFENNKELI
jgi:DNA modification methylase